MIGAVKIDPLLIERGLFEFPVKRLFSLRSLLLLLFLKPSGRLFHSYPIVDALRRNKQSARERKQLFPCDRFPAVIFNLFH